jgi:hypothetical protein
VQSTLAHVEELALNHAVARVLDAVGEVNRYLAQTAPWRVAREGNDARVATILYSAARAQAVCTANCSAKRKTFCRCGAGWGGSRPRTLGMGWRGAATGGDGGGRHATPSTRCEREPWSVGRVAAIFVASRRTWTLSNGNHGYLLSIV